MTHGTRPAWHRFPAPARQAARPDYRGWQTGASDQPRGWSLSVSKPGPMTAAAQARDVAQPCAASVMHISTAPAVHRFAGADQQLYLKCPQVCAQGVILAGQWPAGEREPREKASDTASALLPEGEEVTFMRIAC